MSEDQKPLLRVVNPDATPEEVAAVVAVLPRRRRRARSGPRRTARSGAPCRTGQVRGAQVASLTERFH